MVGGGTEEWGVIQAHESIACLKARNSLSTGFENIFVLLWLLQFPKNFPRIIPDTSPMWKRSVCQATSETDATVELSQISKQSARYKTKINRWK